MKSVLFTDRKKVKNLIKIVKNLPKNSAIIIREYDLDKNARKEFAKEIFKLRKNKSDFKILIGKDFSLAQELKADGVHFSDFDKLPLQFLQRNSFTKNFIFSFACHSEKSLLQAQKLKAHMVFISPIFPSTSHDDAKIFGIQNLAKIAIQNKNHRQIPLFALGGINKQNLKMLKKLPLQGFGAIDYFTTL